METNFTVEQISNVAKKVRIYKKLQVTTRGQMFLNKIDAEEAVRTLNMIIDDTNEHVGILEITEDMMTVEKLREFGRTPKLFDALFSKAKIPVSKAYKKQHERKIEKPSTDDKKIVDEVEAALSGGKKEEPKVAPKVEPKVEPKVAPKVEPKK